MRLLKHHEKRLLSKVDLVQYKDNNVRENLVISRYMATRNDYKKYNQLVGLVKKLVDKLSLLDPKDTFRDKTTDALIDKLYRLGLITTTKLSTCQKITVSAFCRRRLAVVLFRLKMAETLKLAITFIQQGHVRVGPHVVTDPAFLVSKTMEDYITWVDQSKIKRKVLKYNDELDDFDLL
jgi:U3 small nucleolar ribonucleoprotein protein IMP3